ncbi:MAG: DUF4595 domain-containing protein [Thermoflavifilum sp.]|nr:DUF4595 domain-containing protein [Thermoflavifilum sp.]
MKTKIVLCALLFPAFFLGIGCKKKDKELKKPDCRIITVSQSSGDSFYFTYNTDGKVQTITQGTLSTTFTYSGQTAIATTTDNGTFKYKKIITFNDNGLATNIKTEYNLSGTDWTNDALEYSGTQLVKYTSTSSNGGTPFVQTVTWTNGNPTTISTVSGGSSTYTLEYYTDKLFQPGDYFHINYFIQGIQVIKAKNLIKSISSGSEITNFSYSFDSDGKISSLTVITGTGTKTYNYQYLCQ